MSLVGEWDIIGTTRENSSIYTIHGAKSYEWYCLPTYLKTEFILNWRMNICKRQEF